MAKSKTKQVSNPFIELFTGKDFWSVSKTAWDMENTFHNYYKYKNHDYIVFGVRSRVVETGQLSEDTINEHYNAYAKEANKLKGHYGVELEFLHEGKKGDEDDL